MTKRTKAILSLCGVFLVGALCGALALGMFVRQEVRSAQRLRERSGFREYFADQLELTTAQRDSLQGELDRFYTEFAGLRNAAAGEFHDLIDSLDGRLVAHLSPDQVRRLRATEDRLRRQLEARRPAPLVERVAAPSPAPEPAPRDSDSVLISPPPARTPARTSESAPLTKATADTAASSDTLPNGAADPGPEITRFEGGLKERLKLSDQQYARVRGIIKGTKGQIRRDVGKLRGYPRMQVEISGQHLRAMDRAILEVLDESQRTAYEPIREEIARSIRAKLIRHWQKKKGGRGGRRGKRQDAAPSIE